MTELTRSRLVLLLVVFMGTLLLAGCSGDDDGSTSTTATTDEASEVVDTGEVVEPDGDAPVEDGSTTEPAAAPAPTAAQLEQLAKRPAGEDGLREAATRARLVAEDSQFGTVLFDSNGQVVYAFENDTPGTSACTSRDCVKAWPPMLTKDAPTAGRGIDAAALGTITRDDGSIQVTYHDRPLYFYEHEAPGEIKCHNVNLHGGLWWVVKPNGKNA